MDYKKLADDFYRCRYFFTLQEYFNKHSITSEDIKKTIKLELLEIQKEEKQKDQLLDVLLKSCRAFKFSTKNNRNNYMIYSPSAKYKGYFQLTFFYNNIPSSHIERDNIPELKKEIRQYMNRYNYLETAIGKLA